MHWTAAGRVLFSDERVAAIEAGVRAAYPVPLAGTVAEQVFARGDLLDFHDMIDNPAVPPYMRGMMQRVGVDSSMLTAPLLWEGHGIGTLAISRSIDAAYSERHGFSPREHELLQTFAHQAVVAIRNARLFREPHEALERQTATAEILRVISDSPTDVQPVFDAVARRAAVLCHADGARVSLLRDGVLHAMTGYGRNYAVTPLEPLPLRRTSIAGRTALERRAIHVEDALALVDSEYPDVRELQARLGFRTVLNVPLLRDGEAIGTIGLLRNQVCPFSPAEMALVHTFADQAVIAIQNVRLFNETQQALERQTATADILAAISASPTDAAPVFQAIAERARALCRADVSATTRLEGNLVHLAGVRCATPQAEEAMRGLFPMPLADASPNIRRAIADRAPVQIADVRLEPGYQYVAEAEDRMGFRSIMSVPLLHDGRAIGTIGVARREAGLFPDAAV